MSGLMSLYNTSSFSFKKKKNVASPIPAESSSSKLLSKQAHGFESIEVRP